jgi:hypothetical protein
MDGTGARAQRSEAPTGAHAVLEQADRAPALDVIRLLAGEIGPRRSCSDSERRAAVALVEWLRDRGVEATLEEFRAYSSFGRPYALMLGASLLGGLLSARRPAAGAAVSIAALASLVAEADLRFTPVSDALSRRPSANVVATVAPRGELRHRVCICGHMDSTRSGLMFHPGVVAHLAALVQVPAVSAALTAAGPLIGRLPLGRSLRKAALAGLVFSLGMIAERELRGEDVPGASDNASGSAVAAQLVAECAETPLEHTEVRLLITGCEEAGMLGSQAYMRRHAERASATTFLNFDTVGGDVPLTYILNEGSGVSRPASPRLVAMLERIVADKPELGLRAAKRTPGLPTDATPALARGYEAITVLAQGRTIPNYHWPTDTFENIEPRTVAAALATGRELLRRIDAGE